MVDKNNKKSSKGLAVFFTILFISMFLFITGYIVSRSVNPFKIKVYSTAIDDMVISIPDSDIHVKMGVEIETENGDELKEIEDNIDAIKEEIINITESIDEDMATLPNATEIVKKKIKAYLDENYKSARVKGVYFNDYVTQ